MTLETQVETTQAVVDSNKGKHNIKLDYGMPDIYKAYKSNGGKLPYNVYKKVIEDFNLGISHRIITEGIEFRLPHRLGFLRIRSTKQKIPMKDGRIDKARMPIDWATTRRIWKEDYPNLTNEEIFAIKNKPLVYHTNEHANGYIMRWYWDRRVATVKNQGFYGFKPVKGKATDDLYYGKRGLAGWIKGDEYGSNLNYFE